MAKLTNVRERVHQPFRDTLIRTAGLSVGNVSERNTLFTNGNNQKTLGETNLKNGSTLPSDQSMIILALRGFAQFRNSILRGGLDPLSGSASPTTNGDVSIFPNASGNLGVGNALGSTKDVFRLYTQTNEQLFWTFGAGDKPSIIQMPMAYFPYGGGLVTDLAASSDLISGSIGLQSHGSILKLARAILLVPRQTILCNADIQPWPDGGNGTTFGTTQSGRNMLSLVANLNAIDGISKVVSFTFDGLLSRDVQLSCQAGRGRKRPFPARLKVEPPDRDVRRSLTPPTRPASGGAGVFSFVQHRPSRAAPQAVAWSPDRKVEHHTLIDHRRTDKMTQGQDPIRQMYGVLQQLQSQVGYLQRTGQAAKADIDNMRLQIANQQGMIEAFKSVGIRTSGGGGGSGRRGGPMSKGWGGDSYINVSDIPGRYIPYDFSVDIPIANGSVAAARNSLYVTMDGPFVAVARFAIFRSVMSFSYTTPAGQNSVYSGRTNGRFRPVTSVNDYMDAIRAFEQPSQYQPSYVGAVVDAALGIVPVANPVGIHGGATGVYNATTDVTNLLPNFPGTGRPLNESPISMASGRSMGFDGLLSVVVQGANYRRQNNPVPSSLWVHGQNGPQKLAVEDVFDPGETIEIEAIPLHPVNPAYGNISSLARRQDTFTYAAAAGGAANDPLPVGPFPFIGGQFDGHEGIDDETINGDASTTPDRVVRDASGILTVGYMGYKIVQAPIALPG